MKKFAFSLEKILDFKRQLLNVKMNELTVFQEKLKELKKQIDGLNNEFATINQKMIEEFQSGLNSNDVALYKMYFNTLNQKIKELVEDRKQLSDIIEQKKMDVIELNSGISGLEKLRDKQLTKYTKDNQKIYELEMDEYVNQKRSSVC